METTTYTFHSDAGHGWLEVDLRDLVALGLKQTDFSRYSYKKGTRLFLEEDCDAAKFDRAYVAKHGEKLKYTSNYIKGDAAIRNYSRLPGPAA